MEGGDRWSMLNFVGDAHDKTIINRIMLRFRPIAPKSVTGDSVSGDSMPSNKNLVVTSKRAKRKFVRVCKKNNRKRRILGEAKEDNDGNKALVALPLMPEKADLEKSMVVGRLWDVDDDLDRSVAYDVARMGFSNQASIIFPGRRMNVVESWVTAESVTGTCMDGGEMRKCTDVEKMKNLEKDTCPAFASDGMNRVYWVNQAYKNMVGLDDEVEEDETSVGLVVKDGFIFPHGAFSCLVRLQYGGRKGMNYSKMVPCDVWKMRSSGFAWRLDVKAALSLGL